VVPRRVLDEDAAGTVALVLEHAADALTIGRLLGDDPVGPELEAQGELLQDLLRSTTLDEQELAARARALGLPAAGVLTAVVLGTDSDGRDRDTVEAAVVAARTVGVPALVGRMAAGRVGLVVSCGSRESEPATVERLAVHLSPAQATVIGAAGPVTSFSGLPSALAEAAFVVDVATSMESGEPHRIWRGSDLGARGLLWQLRNDPRLLSFVDAQLGPLLRLDEPARGTMLQTLLAYLDAGGVVTDFARAVHLSRPAAYARLRRLGDLLGRDLEHPRTRLSMHLALLALDQQPAATDAELARDPRAR
jgi:purine catabolism regulator